MKILENSRVLLSLAVIVGAAAGVGCVSKDDGTDGNDGAAGSPTTASGGSGTGGAGATTSAAGTTAAAGSTTAAAGDASQPEGKLCATKTVVTAPLLADFEAYDGVSLAEESVFSFNGDADGNNAIYVGGYGIDDESPNGMFTFQVVAGHDSYYALGISNTEASVWGGALGMWMGCMDATSYQGISFWARGSTPAGTGTFSYITEDTSAPGEDDPSTGGTCDAGEDCAGPSVDFTVTADWTQYMFTWSSFMPGSGSGGVSVPANGDNIAGLNWGVHMMWVLDPADTTGETWIPTPDAFELAIDDISFF